MSVLDQAIRSLEQQVDVRLKASIGSREWYELQAYGRGVTFLKTIKVAGLEDQPGEINDYRRALKVETE